MKTVKNERILKQISRQSGYSISDLLDQETIDRLFDQVTNPKHKKIQGRLSLQDFRCKIPFIDDLGLVPKETNSRPVWVITPKTGSAKKLFEALIWTALYGKKFSIIHWYLIYHLFEKQMNKNAECLALLRILRVSTTRVGKAYNTKIKPMRVVVQNVLGRERGLAYLKKIEQDLGLKLPQEDPHLENLLRIVAGRERFKKSPEPRRIGVGYKDKGTLPKGSKEEPECAEDYLVQINDLFVELLEKTSEVEIFTNYDPKKSERLQAQISTFLKQ